MKPQIVAPLPKDKARPYVFIIAGSDPSGGAGLQSDIKTALECGCESGAVSTAETVQTGNGVRKIYPANPKILNEQLSAIGEDITPDAVKIGIAPGSEIINVIAEFLKKIPNVPVVLDPVCVSSSGYEILNAAALQALNKTLLPLVSCVTPNIYELQRLCGKQDIEAAAQLSCDVVVTGGEGTTERATDYYVTGAGVIASYSWKRTPGGERTRGTGCIFSTALACYLAQGRNIEDAVFHAKNYVSVAIATARSCGAGRSMAGRVNASVTH